MLHISTHPLVKRDMTVLRDHSTTPAEFRRTAARVATLLAAEALRALPVAEVHVQTPLAQALGAELAAPVVLAPVLRAGLGMLDAVHSIIPDAAVAHIGIYRDEVTLEPVEYYGRYPELSGSLVFLLDPMLATGGSATAAIDLLTGRGAREVVLICLVAAPEGVQRITQQFPDVMIHTAALDNGLNEHGYILPGLGDAGDRLFGTF